MSDSTLVIVFGGHKTQIGDMVSTLQREPTAQLSWESQPKRVCGFIGPDAGSGRMKINTSDISIGPVQGASSEKKELTQHMDQKKGKVIVNNRGIT